MPKEKWKIFKNHHEPIIDEETWNTVQRIRNNKRRPTKTGKQSLVIYFVKIVEQSFIIVLLITLQQIKTFIDVPIIKTIPQMLVLVIISEILS